MTGSLPDFGNYDDEKLDAARVAIATEQERRSRIATIPAQVQQLAAAYAAGGGDPADLTLDPGPFGPPAAGDEPAG